MNGHEEMPKIGFASEGPTYDTMHSILNGWCVRVWLTGGCALVAQWDGEATLPNGEDGTRLIAWNTTAENYINPVVVPTDDIRKIEVL